MMRKFAVAAALLISLAPLTGVNAQSTVVGIAVDNRGNVGIGTQTPQKKLDVTGDALVQGTVFGTGGGGQFGQAATVAGFDYVYGTRGFVLAFNPQGATPNEQIQIYALSPTDPGQSSYKTFVIPHPEDSGRYLVHATLEGPEAAVYYRGSAKLEGGRAVVRLPHYFEALTRAEGRTIQLTNIGGFDRLAVETRNGMKIADGTFAVISDNPHSAQGFDWEVKAVRSDGAQLEVEPRKSERVVAGIGPYTYSYPAQAEP